MEEEKSPYRRTIPDVLSAIEHAKLSQSELRPLTQSFNTVADWAEYRLLELDKDVLECLERGDRVVFRGRKDDRAVLCTSTATYEVKEAETSNMMLLVPGLKFAEDVEVGNGRDMALEQVDILNHYGDYLELKKIKPTINRLRCLLNENPYKGSEFESDESDGYYDMNCLLEHVQASEAELKGMLEQLGAFEIYGKVRLLDPEFHFKSLSLILNLIEENDWPCDGVPIGETLSALREQLSPFVLNHLFQTYFEPTGDYSDDGDELFKLNEFKTCRFLGEYLLRHASRFKLNEFLQVWSASVPRGLTTDLSTQLAGLALISTQDRYKVVAYFPESDLSEDIHERFAQLFAQQATWTLNEIRPYVECFATEKQSVNALLTKHSRASNVNGVKCYSARHGK